MCDEPRSVGEFEIIGREFPFGAFEDLAVSDATRPDGTVVVEIEHAFDTLDIHCQPLKPIGQLRRNRIAFDPADLLEIGELANLHAVEPNLPAEPPGPQCRALPIVLNKADIMKTGIEADRRQTCEIEILAVRGCGLQDDLQL